MNKYILMFCLLGSVIMIEANSRFQYLADDVIYDGKTKLYWYAPKDKLRNKWEDAITKCKHLSANSLNQWRLPNIKEYYTLARSYDLSSNEVYTKVNAYGQYITSTSVPNNPKEILTFEYKGLSSRRVTKTSEYEYLCVRNK